METKKLIQSRSFWLAVVEGLIGVWSVVQDQAPTLGWVLTVGGVLQIVLRFLTSVPITGAVKIGAVKER